MKKTTVFFTLWLLSAPALAFDRLNCDSALNNWTVHNAVKAKEAVLTSDSPNAHFTREKSMMLIVRDEKKRDIAVVSPWNDIQFFKGNKADTPKYKFDFKTDSETQFTLDITDSAKQVHSISCKLTF